MLEAMGVYAAESDRIARLHKDLSATIRAAQADDGYLNTFYQNPLNMAAGHKRFQTENRFEFYNFGHYTQAAIAHYRATGDRQLLDSAVRFADLIVENFADPGDLPYRKWKTVVNQKYEHPNHELAMVELYRQTGNRRYLDFARQTYEEYEFFGPKFEEIWGHAVQETLLYAGAADLYLETGDQDVRTTVDRLWRDMQRAKTVHHRRSRLAASRRIVRCGLLPAARELLPGNVRRHRTLLLESQDAAGDRKHGACGRDGTLAV